MRVRVKAGSVELLAELNESLTARRIAEALPIRSTAQVWGNEVYFSTGLALGGENLQSHAPPGAVAYWPPGKALCLFFGQRPASPVTIVGELRGDPWRLASVRPGDEVIVERAEDEEPPHPEDTADPPRGASQDLGPDAPDATGP